jgi:hypothetical protein
MLIKAGVIKLRSEIAQNLGEKHGISGVTAKLRRGVAGSNPKRFDTDFGQFGKLGECTKFNHCFLLSQSEVGI